MSGGGEAGAIQAITAKITIIMSSDNIFAYMMTIVTIIIILLCIKPNNNNDDNSSYGCLVVISIVSIILLGIGLAITS